MLEFLPEFSSSNLTKDSEKMEITFDFFNDELASELTVDITQANALGYFNLLSSVYWSRGKIIIQFKDANTRDENALEKCWNELKDSLKKLYSALPAKKAIRFKSATEIVKKSKAPAKPPLQRMKINEEEARGIQLLQNENPDSSWLDKKKSLPLKRSYEDDDSEKSPKLHQMIKFTFSCTTQQNAVETPTEKKELDNATEALLKLKN